MSDEQRCTCPVHGELERMEAAVHPPKEECACQKALENIRRIPSLPFPDPGAHSQRAFTDAVYRAYSEIQRTVNFALATSCHCAELREEKRSIEEALGFCGNPGEAAYIITKKQQALEMTRATAKRRGEERDGLRAELAAANERAVTLSQALSFEIMGVRKAEAELATARKDLAEAVEALRIIQWGDSVLGNDGETVYHLCPRCDQSEVRGHSPDCEVGAMLERFDAQGGGNAK